MNGEDCGSTEPSATDRITFQAHRGPPEDGLDNEEDLKSPGISPTASSLRTSSRYLAAGLSVSEDKYAHHHER